MITITVPFDNPLNQKTYENLINTLQFHQLQCTCGHSGCLTIHGYYPRSLKEMILKSLYLSAGLNALTVVKPMLCFLPSLCLIPRYPYRSRLLSYLLMRIPEILNRSWTELLLLMKILFPPSPNAISCTGCRRSVPFGLIYPSHPVL